MFVQVFVVSLVSLLLCKKKKRNTIVGKIPTTPPPSFLPAVPTFWVGNEDDVLYTACTGKLIYFGFSHSWVHGMGGSSKFPLASSLSRLKETNKLITN